MSQKIMASGEMGTLDLPSVVEALMLQYRDKWLRFVRKIVENPFDAEDVVQEAAMRMLACTHEFRSSEHARMYLGRIISNTAIELYHSRRRIRMRRRELHEALLPPSLVNSPDQCLRDLEASRYRAYRLCILRQGLAHLPDKQYEALRLIFMNVRTVSIRDAGVKHNIPYSTLRHRTLEGIRRLQRHFRRALRALPLGK